VEKNRQEKDYPCERWIETNNFWRSLQQGDGEENWLKKLESMGIRAVSVVHTPLNEAV
jgi:hypothetical protein